MRALIQRVKSASVSVDGKDVSSIGNGLLVFLGVEDNDNEKQLHGMVKKLSKLRIFRDGEDRMNLSVLDVGGEVLLVSQFTLYANLNKGNRPSFVSAGEPTYAEMMYEKFGEELEKLGIRVGKGIFGADMLVRLENDGPVTIWMDSDDVVK